MSHVLKGCLPSRLPEKAGEPGEATGALMYIRPGSNDEHSSDSTGRLRSVLIAGTHFDIKKGKEATPCTESATAASYFPLPVSFFSLVSLSFTVFLISNGSSRTSSKSNGSTTMTCTSLLRTPRFTSFYKPNKGRGMTHAFKPLSSDLVLH